MTEIKNQSILNEVATYYTGRLAEHGQTPRGVDWNGEESQVLRFRQLCRIINSEQHFSLCDLGCGYGALYEFMKSEYPDFTYIGTDVSQDMVKAAQQRFAGDGNARFAVSASPVETVDFAVASGIFNVRQQRSDDEWFDYIIATLDALNAGTTAGFSFNCLTSYSDADKMRDYLYYADPMRLFDHCKRHYSRNVAVLHDYGLYEFTILVRKTL